MTYTKSKLRCGIAGHGVIGKRRQTHIQANPHFTVTAVCDATYDEAGGEFPDGVRFYKTYQDLLAKEDLDVLFVCLPNNIASETTIAGLQRDLHVFCEKPPGRNVQDIEAVRAVEATKPHLKLKYGFNHRYHYSVMEALNIIRSGRLGKIINLRGVYGKSAFTPWPRPQATGSAKDDMKAWRTSRAIAGGGILLDQGIHMVDLMTLFAGEFTEIHSFVSNGYWQHDVEDNAYALMRTADGVVAMMHSTATQWQHRFRLEISLTEGSLELSGILSGTKSYGTERLTVVAREDRTNGLPPEQSTTYVQDDSWQMEIDEFAEAVVLDKTVEIGCSYDALTAMRVVQGVYNADPEWRQFIAVE